MAPAICAGKLHAGSDVGTDAISDMVHHKGEPSALVILLKFFKYDLFDYPGGYLPQLFMVVTGLVPPLF